MSPPPPLQEVHPDLLCTEFLFLNYKCSELFFFHPKLWWGKGTLAGWAFTLCEPGVLIEAAIAIKGLEEFHSDKRTQGKRTP